MSWIKLGLCSTRSHQVEENKAQCQRLWVLVLDGTQAQWWQGILGLQIWMIDCWLDRVQFSVVY